MSSWLATWEPTACQEQRGSLRDAVRCTSARPAPSTARPPVQRDSIFRIASMTKPVTAVAVLALAEDGVLRLDDPLDRWLPELADRRVMIDPRGSVADTVPAARQPTVHDALTFRLGWVDRFGPSYLP
jgi:CubicO group peptidase (beta-lactamase class C family)